MFIDMVGFRVKLVCGYMKYALSEVKEPGLIHYLGIYCIFSGFSVIGSLTLHYYLLKKFISDDFLYETKFESDTLLDYY